MMMPTGKMAGGTMQFVFDYREDKKFRKMTVSEERQLATKLAHYEKLTFDQFRKASRLIDWKGNLAIKAPPELSPEISEVVWRFRCGDKMRVFGFLNENIFYVWLVDPTHKSGGR